jgi:HAD superfamily hydrolase (TIGR01490 family)
MPARPKLAALDLDHTLLAGDSDVLWCEFLMQRGVLDRAGFEARNAAMERDYRAGTVSTQAFCEFYIGTLAGRTPFEWHPLRQAFLNDIIVPRIGQKARALLRELLAEGALVVMTTATNRYITELTALHLELDHLIATEVELGADGRFTGRTRGTPNMREGKVQRLKEWLAERGQALADFDSWGYSDSANDLPLLQAVDHAVVVHPDPRLAAEAERRGWQQLALHESAS